MNIDYDMLKQLSLNSDLNSSDAELLKRVLTGITSGNKVKMTPQERNKLMAKLSNQTSNEYVATKDVSEMNDEERQAHREALRKKLRDKQRAAEQARAGGNPFSGKKKQTSVNSAMSNLNDILSKLDMNQLNNHAEQIAQNTINQNAQNTQTPTAKQDKVVVDENLDDYVN